MSKKHTYVCPEVELLQVKGLSFLFYFSGDGDIQQWEDKDDFGDTEDYYI